MIEVLCCFYCYFLLDKSVSPREERNKSGEPEEWAKETPPPGTSEDFGHLSNLKFKSFENAADRGSREVAPGGKQMFTVSLIHAGETFNRCCSSQRALFFLQGETRPPNARPSTFPFSAQMHNGICVPDALRPNVGFLLLYVLAEY